MKPRTLEKLRYFQGKICTIFSSPINRKFDEETSRKYFVVRVQDIDSDGVWGTHLGAGTVAWFTAESIRSIHEELELDPGNPEHAKIIEQLESEAKPQPAQLSNSCTGCAVPINEPPAQRSNGYTDCVIPIDEPPPQEDGDATFINIEALTKLAAQTKQSYESMDE